MEKSNLRAKRAQMDTLIGKRIVSIDLRPFEDGREGYALDPTIAFEDGTVLYFEVDETETSDYSIYPILTRNLQ